jgi:hypothetical protein
MILYTGNMRGWYQLPASADGQNKSTPTLKCLLQRLLYVGRVRLVELDLLPHSPLFIARAIQEATKILPQWKNRVVFKIVGSSYPQAAVEAFLQVWEIADVVDVNPPVPATELPNAIANAHLLFMTMHTRKDNAVSNITSAKTYEYLLTNRPILAAIQHGEMADILKPHPGTYITSAGDVAGMAATIVKLLQAVDASTFTPVCRPDAFASHGFAACAAQFEAELFEAISESRGCTSAA